MNPYQKFISKTTRKSSAKEKQMELPATFEPSLLDSLETVKQPLQSEELEKIPSFFSFIRKGNKE